MSRLQLASSIMQRLPSFKGKRRVCRLLINTARLSQKKNIIVNTKSGKFELPNLKEIISFDLFTSGVYENGLVQFLTKAIPTNGVFLDAGANIGSISIPLAIKRPDVKVIAIEASPWIFEVLQRNVQLNSATNVTALNYALYSESGKKVGIYAPKELFGKGSLNPIFTKDAELVETVTIDDVVTDHRLNRLDLVKVDVEGFEAAVFAGMINTAKSNKPKITFEFSRWAETSAGFEAGQAQRLLIDYGYNLQRFDTRFRLVGSLSSNIIIPDEGNLFAS